MLGGRHIGPLWSELSPLDDWCHDNVRWQGGSYCSKNVREVRGGGGQGRHGGEGRRGTEKAGR